MKTKFFLGLTCGLLILINTQTQSQMAVVDVSANVIQKTMLAKQVEEAQERLMDLSRTSNFIKNSSTYHETVRLMESAVCTFEGLDLLLEKQRILGIKNCFFDFEIQANILRIKNSAWVVTTAMLAWEKSSTLDRSSKVAEALEAFNAAHKDLYDMKKEMSKSIQKEVALRQYHKQLNSDMNFIKLML